MPVVRDATKSEVILYDVPSYKRVLDEALLSALERGALLEEDLSYGNAKLLIMAAASASAVIAQLWPLPFPDNRVLLCVCVVIYFGLSGVYQVLTSFIDQDFIFTSKPRKAAGAAAGGRAPVVVRASLSRFSERYTAIVECPRGREVSRMELALGGLFTAGGEFAELKFEREVQRHLLPALVALDASVEAEVAERRRKEDAEDAAEEAREREREKGKDKERTAKAAAAAAKAAKKA
jgi:hypothetical protein